MQNAADAAIDRVKIEKRRLQRDSGILERRFRGGEMS